MFYTTNLEDTILIEPLFSPSTVQNNRLVIITGYINVDRIKKHVLRLKDEMEKRSLHFRMTIDIIIGMRTGLKNKKRDDIIKCIRGLNEQKGMPKISCFVIEEGKEVHSKVYIWCANRKPNLAYCGSVNYTTDAFEKRRESIASCEPNLAYEYYKMLKRQSKEISAAPLSLSIEEKSNNVEDVDEDTEELWENYNDIAPIETLELSLLKADGSDVGHGSGVNWGHRQNGTKRNLNQAYIPYPAKARKESKGFFPDERAEGMKNYPIFKVLLEHGDSCYMRLCQQNIKGIQTADSNATLGLWIRKEIGANSGVFVTKEMLDKSGKSIARFEKYSDGIYRLSLVSSLKR